jgi:hypothetical protein
MCICHYLLKYLEILNIFSGLHRKIIYREREICDMDNKEPIHSK